MLLTEKEARAICEKLLGYVKADDAVVGVTSENYGHSTNEIDDDSLKATIALAEQLARISPVDREYMPSLSKQTYKPVNGYAEATSNISVTALSRRHDQV